MLVPSALVSGPVVNTLINTNSSGAGSALQAVPKRTSRVIRMEVNSIDRDYSKYPLSSEFTWDLPFPIKEIREVRLIGGTIPVPFLNIDTPWNTFTFCEGSSYFELTIPPGCYTIANLIPAIQALLNGINIGNVYTVTQIPITGQIKITTTGVSTFYLLFGSGTQKDVFDFKTKSILQLRCPARLLGWGLADYTSSNGVLIAPRAPNLWYCLERSYLYFNFDSTQDLRSIFRGSGRKEPSAIIYHDELNNYNFPSPVFPLTKYLNKETFDTSIVPAPAALSRIRSINISLRDMFYNLINTQGRELSLLLELVICD